MFRKDFIVAIKNSKGEVLREQSKDVFIPFHEEYGILLKNNTKGKCAVKISIDGTSVSDKNFILDGYNSCTLERFCLDGDLNSGNKFKFVPLSDSNVQDPTSSKNGIIKVEVWREKYIVTNTVDSVSTSNYPYCTTPTTFGSGVPYIINLSSTCSTNDYSCIIKKRTLSTSGATVSGSKSNQKFIEVKGIDKSNSDYFWFEFQLKGIPKESEFNSKSDIYCTKCGNRCKRNHNFCSKCGNGIVAPLVGA